MLNEAVLGTVAQRRLNAPVQQDHGEAVSPRMDAVTSAVRAHCLKTCALGPTVCTLKHGPDGPSEVSVTTCQAPCENNLQDAMAAPRGEDLRQALAKSGADYVLTDHYDEGAQQ